MPEVKSQIAFEEVGLGSVLKRWRLVVPPNQREYSWSDLQVTQLLQDFAKAINEEGPYFLGTIVTIPKDEGTLEVVDGQQRLATTAILLSAIRDYSKEIGEDFIVQSIDNEFLSGIDRDRRVRVPKLSLNLDDNELFDRIVTGVSEAGPGPLRTSHERLLNARDQARRHVLKVVAPLEQKGHGDLLNQWVSFVEFRALVVLLKVPEIADAYKMFETLNDRGLRTSQADLIKNFLFARAGKRQAEAQSKWSFMRGALESASDDPDITITFLRHALIVQGGHLREVDVYTRVQEIVKSEPAAVTFASTIEMLANTYVATTNPENERWNSYPDSVRRAIVVFNLFDIKPMKPLILAISEKFDPKETAAAFDFLVSLGVRLIIASSTRTSSVEVPLATAAKDVFEGTIVTTQKLKESLKPLTPLDAEFRAAFATTRVSVARLARYYLRSLERTAKGEPEPWFEPQDDKQVINLEHVLPRKPEGNWPQFDEGAAKLYSVRLGNLALMKAADNSALKSEKFEDKKAVYALSPYVLTSQIAEADRWRAEEIDARQSGLADLAVRAWPV